MLSSYVGTARVATMPMLTTHMTSSSSTTLASTSNNGSKRNDRAAPTNEPFASVDCRRSSKLTNVASNQEWVRCTNDQSIQARCSQCCNFSNLVYVFNLKRYFYDVFKFFILKDSNSDHRVLTMLRLPLNYLHSLIVETNLFFNERSQITHN